MPRKSASRQQGLQGQKIVPVDDHAIPALPEAVPLFKHMEGHLLRMVHHFFLANPLQARHPGTSFPIVLSL